VAVVHLGLAEGRARLALERVALNVMDYRIPDNAGYRAEGEPCATDGPAAYFASLPLPEMLAALTAEGIPAYVSNTAGPSVQQTPRTLHEIPCGAEPRWVHPPRSCPPWWRQPDRSADMDLPSCSAAWRPLRVVAEPSRDPPEGPGARDPLGRGVSARAGRLEGGRRRPLA
jgi:hypothetical protein